MFQKCSHEAVQSIITNLKMEIYLPGDYCSHLWKCWRYVFLAYIWSMRYFKQERGEPFGMLKADQHFGEGALLDGNEYEATVKAITYCNFNTLSRSKYS